jgi:magnesium transporter
MGIKLPRRLQPASYASEARVAAREVVTGALLGMILASLAFPLVWVGWGDPEVAAAVALAMFAASAIATCVAMSLPWMLQRLGKDRHPGLALLRRSFRIS